MSASEDSGYVRVVARVMFPAQPRTFLGQRLAKIVARALHVLCVAGFFGGHVFATHADQIAPWLLATIGSGLLILMLDLYQSAAFLVQARGLVLFGKLGLLSSTWWAPAWSIPALAAIIVLSVLSSHAPSKFRYYVVFGRVAAARTPG